MVLMTDREWLKDNVGKHCFHPMSDPKDVQRSPPPILAQGEGVYVTDIDGNRMLDCQAGLWCVNAGYGRQEIIDAVTTQMKELAYCSMFPGNANIPATRLAAKLCEVTDYEGMARALFSSGGSDAVETALKTARQYWKLVGEPDRYKFISLRNGYHGLHFGGMSASGLESWRRNYEPLLPGFINVEAPNLYRNPFTDDPQELADICIQLMEREILFQGSGTVAAVIAEPVQGAGGVNVPPESYWPKLRALCDRYGILLIADEVITGFGRSGSLFGSRGWNVKPDIMCLAKGLTNGYVPLGATLLNKRLESAWLANDADATMMHGYTYSGHPVACAAGLASIELVLNENFAENARVVGDYFLNQLQALKERHSAIGDVRGKGLMIAIELVRDRKSKTPFAGSDKYPTEVSQLCQKNGLIFRVSSSKFILSPPLVFSKANVDEAVRVIDMAFSQCSY